MSSRSPVRRTAPLTTRQRDAIRTWQRTDRSYELVQGVLRGTIDRATLSRAERARTEGLIDDLAMAVASGRTRRRMTVYRGLRSVRRTFGVDRLADVPADPPPLAGYVATSIHRDVAITQFTAARGALLEVELPADTPALWVAGEGDERLRHQGELLLQDKLRLRIVAARREAELDVLSVTVIAR